MSRSIKKLGILKDEGFAMSLYNKNLRRINKQRIRVGKEPLLMREVVNDYDVCDYKFSWIESTDILEAVSEESMRVFLKRQRIYFGK